MHELEWMADSSTFSSATLNSHLISISHNCLSSVKQTGWIKIFQVLYGYKILWFYDSGHLESSFILHVAALCLPS